MRTGQKVGIGTGIAAAVIIAVVVSLMPVSEEMEVEVHDMIAGPTDAMTEEKIKVVASFYPLYEFARNVGGERAAVTTFIPVGVEPHDWDPSPRDIQNLGNVDVFVYNGAGFEPWVDRVLTSGILANAIVVEATRNIELVEEDHDDHGHGPVDPHVWLDPILAKHQVALIKSALIEADPVNSQYYEENAEKYMVKLDALDAKIRAKLSNCERDTFVSFHQAFGYFAQRYGLHEVSLGGISPEIEVSPAEIRDLIDFVRANNIKVIYAEELVDPRLAEVLASEVGARVMILSPIEGLTEEEAREGMTYIEKMEQNLQNLKVGLECL